MLIDLRQGGPELFEADVAIVGSGAAGNALARSLLETGLKVLLLESGGLDYEPETADLNRGINVGQPYYDLDRARLRFFGGTTAIWGGRCAELDPIDLQQRAWVPHSGWPIGIDELRPWYQAARSLLDIPAPERSVRPGLLDQLATGELAVKHWCFDHDFERFGAARNADLINHPNAVVAIHATVRELVPNAAVSCVDHLQIRSGSGRAHRANARTYVLAAGGLENPRILLASNSVAPAGLGNDHDLVGRFFMEHPHGRGGRIVGAPVWRLLNAFRARRLGRTEVAPLITLTDEAQRRERALNGALTVAARPPPDGKAAITKRGYQFIKHRIGPTSRGRALWRAYRRVLRRARPLWSAALAARCLAGQEEPTLVLRAEQAPNPDSRVTLTGDVDSTGMPRISLDWRMNRQDVDSAAALVNAFARQARVAGVGEVEVAKWLDGGGSEWVTDPLVSAHPIGGYHHIGTTRMAADPKRGVTDQWGRVHGLSNLYVAGSSLFPTSGWANPTLTIIALALRTAEHIAARTRA